MSLMVASTTVVGTAEVKRAFVEMGSTIRERLRRRMLDLGGGIQQQAKAEAPKATGKLERSIKLRLAEDDKGMRVVIGPPIFYGKFFEEGIPERQVTVKRQRGVVGLTSRTDKFGRVKFKLKKGLTLREQFYTKRFHLDKRPFMEPAMARFEGRVHSELQAIVDGVATEGL